MDLLRFTKNGIYCPKGDFYVDASGKVERNIITHAHSDHARPGHRSYLAHPSTVPLLRARLGKKIDVQSLVYGEEISINGVKVSLHPAGHIYGSSQIKVRSGGEVWVVSGDYKLEDDHLSVPFEPVKCNVFITECTFGLPVYNWPDQQKVYDQINKWWRENKDQGITSLLFGYSLGKSQRIIKNINHSIGSVFVHKTVGTMNEAIILDGGELPKTITINEKINSEDIKGNLIIAPPSITSGRIMQGLAPISMAMASGWIQTGKYYGRSKIDKGFILSDHADWDGLLHAINETRAEKVITMHGYTQELTRWLNEQGINSIEIGELMHQPFKL
ncbi:MAG: ligase-associated DNA damage response exonuclease [Cyclobacteriaceae bacterium]|nr:ligase-associated DNA damage response exonuclease [Cyclobacteriaceae bacterium]